MPIVEIRRLQNFAGMLRPIAIEFDGEQVAALRPRETRLFDVATGGHVLRARMDWVASPVLSLDLVESDHAVLVTRLPWRLLRTGFREGFRTPQENGLVLRQLGASGP